ncbi:hypothetical protein SAMN05444722_0074 [Rhodovulum sp. ES.010]|uniref:hypothetical protein n=1 Tax=Rhodovulum sp. ES.010 TaxID=1882821 RepID=UPI0009292E83|nr:hypothetical protein [Rhodovulum sp. ES.010]SIO00245.1 hypothetical protein SAMN05444722_0074 [Rhodovulum sp. ES.010]
MRPHLQFHQTAERLKSYDMRPGHELLGGTVPVSSPTRARRFFQRYAEPGRAGFVHVTLSAPEGLWLSRPQWLAVFRSVLARHGLPPDMTPWLLVRHTDAACDHAHGFAALCTILGFPLCPNTSPAHTDATHRRLARRLGLEEPH